MALVVLRPANGQRTERWLVSTSITNREMPPTSTSALVYVSRRRHEPTSAARRKSLRNALCFALELAAICDIAIAHGLGSAQVQESLRCASRALSMLGLSFHATAAGCD